MASKLIRLVSGLVILAGALPSVRAANFQQNRDPAPLFQIQNVEPVHLAVLVTSGGFLPQYSGFTTLSSLISGEENSFSIWTLSGPFSSRRDRAMLATAALITFPSSLQTAPIQILEILRLGDEEDFWTLVNSDVIYPIPVEFLERVKDETPIQTPLIDDLEASAYIRVVQMAYQTDAGAFRASARKELTYADLMRQPKTNRGEVVQAQGRLRRLRKIPPPLALRELGVSELYEGWIFQELYGANPTCVIFTTLPAGLSIFEKDDIPVSFQGYFFKKYRYRTASSSKDLAWKDAPLIIGRTINLLPKSALSPPIDDSEWAKNLLPSFLGFIIFVVTFMVGLGYWFRKTDKAVKSRLKKVQTEVESHLFEDLTDALGNQKAPSTTNNENEFHGYKL